MTESEARRFNVLLEEVVGHVRVIAEGHGSLVARMDRLEGRMERLETKVDVLTAHVHTMDVRLGRVERRLNGAAPARPTRPRK
jgi:hypothetical protein